MRRFMLLAAACGLAGLGGHAQAAGTNPCYTECQYRCYVVHPGGGPSWEACYLACAADRCGR